MFNLLIKSFKLSFRFMFLVVVELALMVMGLSKTSRPQHRGSMKHRRPQEGTSQLVNRVPSPAQFPALPFTRPRSRIRGPCGTGATRLLQKGLS